jgi:catechol-2,3-dioxygenase
VTFKIPERMKVGAQVLRVRNVDTVLAFYENNLGLQEKKRYRSNEDDDDGNWILCLRQNV